ncbi:MAG: transposase [Chloroflexota bacterium]|nr:transposase [Chloroflexota bacterium]
MTDSIDHRNHRSMWLKEYDYSQPGAYFVTTCTHDRECLFGEIAGRQMILNDAGKIVQIVWDEIRKHFDRVESDQFVIMPNHIHGIIILNSETVGAGSPRPNQNIGRGDRAPTLGKIVAYFKYQTTKRINESQGTPGYKLWQRNYYEHVIRDENELQNIRHYIRYNHLKWDEDEENPDSKKV